MRGGEAGKAYRPLRHTRIEDDTPIVPRAVAEHHHLCRHFVIRLRTRRYLVGPWVDA